MGDVYPELRREGQRATDVAPGRGALLPDDNGMEILEAAIAALPATGERSSAATSPLLHDTYGFPLDLTADVAASARSPSTPPASRSR